MSNIIKLIATGSDDVALVVNPGERGTIEHLFLENGMLRRVTIVKVDAEVLDISMQLRKDHVAAWQGMYEHDIDLGVPWKVYSGDRFKICGDNIGGRPTLFRVELVFDPEPMGAAMVKRKKR